jgi:hypothetical protein
MIEIVGNIQQVKDVEEMVRKGTLYLSIPFAPHLKHIGGADGDAQINEFSTKYYTRPYEIFGSPAQIETVVNRSDAKLVEFLKWLTSSNINITFIYDYRHNKFSIAIKPEDWHRLRKLLPELNHIVVDVAPNRCEIVQEAT